MASCEMWWCDHCCSDGPDGDDSVVHEDTARDAGWLVLSRAYPYTFSDGKTITLTESLHICPTCQDDEDCREWLSEMSGVQGEYMDDDARLREITAIASTATRGEGDV